jgi:hypothetical protein
LPLPPSLSSSVSATPFIPSLSSIPA